MKLNLKQEMNEKKKMQHAKIERARKRESNRIHSKLTSEPTNEKRERRIIMKRKKKKKKRTTAIYQRSFYRSNFCYYIYKQTHANTTNHKQEMKITKQDTIDTIVC